MAFLTMKPINLTSSKSTILGNLPQSSFAKHTIKEECFSFVWFRSDTRGLEGENETV